MKRREEMGFWERLYVNLYLFEILKGLTVTIGHFCRNLTRFVFTSLGLRKRDFSWSTIGSVIQYPDTHRPYPARFRGRHRLTLNDNGSVRCTSCFLCATACPADCIFIEPAEHDDAEIEKFPHRYEIDTLLCIYCGYCVEACPVDAIRMDTGIHPEIYRPDPRTFIEDKETLMMRSRVLEDKGPDALFKEHMERMQNIERKPFSNTTSAN